MTKTHLRSFVIQAVATGTLAIASLATLPAAAETSAGDAAAAQKLFDDAMQLVASGRATDACPKFEESQRIDPSIGTQFNLADCYERTGRTASAWAHYTMVADAAKHAGDAARERVARERANAVYSRLSYLVVKVHHPETGLEVTRDGQRVGAGVWGSPTPVDPGKHAIVVTAPGKKPWSTEVEFKKDGEKIELTVPALQDAPAGVPTQGTGATTSDVLEPGRWSNRRKIALVTGGVGIVGLGVGTAMLISAKSKYSKADDYCNSAGECTDTRGVTLRHDAITRADWATVPIGVGLAAIGVGVTLWVTDKKAKDSPSTAALRFSPNHIELQGSF